MTLRTFISGGADQCAWGPGYNNCVDAAPKGIIEQLVQPAVELMFVAAVLFFLWNVFKLIKNADQEEERAKFKAQITWGLVAIAVMASVWGLVSVLLGSTGLDTTATINVRTGP